MAQPGGSITQRRQIFEEAQRATAPPVAGPLGSQTNPFTAPGQGQAGQFFRGSRPGQFGFPQPAQLPENIGDVRSLMQRYGQQPAIWQQQVDVENPGFSKTWQGVFNQPQDLPPEAPGSFNLGPQMASIPLGEEAGPSAPWAGWQPASEEWT